MLVRFIYETVYEIKFDLSAITKYLYNKLMSRDIKLTSLPVKDILFHNNLTY